MAGSEDRPENQSLLIAGGRLDPNLTRLIEIAERIPVAVCAIRHGEDDSPPLSWHLGHEPPTVHSRPIPATGAFIRYNVFGQRDNADAATARRAAGWFQTLYGWLLSQRHIKLLNRDQAPAVGNKPAILLEARRLSPRDYRVFYALGEWYYTQKDYRRAAAYFEDTLELRADLSAARYNLGVCLARAGLSERATTVLAELLREEPTHWRAALDLSRLHAAAGQPDTALAIIDTTLKTPPRQPRLYFRKGELHEARGEAVRALAAYE
ncbi:MAG: tetratricopeptide repeat protein, partial [Myxococcota bacterium]